VVVLDIEKIKETITEGEARYDKSNFSEAYKIFEEALNLIDSKDLKNKCRLLRDLGRCDFRLGRNDEAERHWRKSLEICEKINDTQTKVLLFNHLGALQALQGKMDDAVKNFNQGYNLAKEINYDYGLAKILNSYGAFYDHIKNKLEDGTDKFKEALTIFKKIGDKKSLTNTLNLIGTSQIYSGNLEEGYKNLKDALRISREIGDKIRESSILNHIGYVFKLKGSYDEALDCFDKSISIVEKHAYKKGSVGTLLNRGDVYKELKKYELAEKDYFKAFERARGLRHVIGTAVSLKKLGTLMYEVKKQYLLAFLLLSESLTLYGFIFKNFKGEINNENLTQLFEEVPELISEIENIILSDKEKVFPNVKINNLSKEVKKICSLSRKNEQFNPIRNKICNQANDFAKSVPVTSSTIPSDFKKEISHWDAVFYHEWKEYLLQNLFDKLDILSKNELIIMDRLYNFLENKDLCLFLIIRIIERELRRNLFEPLKKIWKEKLLSKLETKEDMLDKVERETVKRLKKSIYDNRRLLSLGEMKYVVNLSTKYFDSEIGAYLGGFFLEKMKKILNFKLKFQNDDRLYSIIKIRNAIAHGTNEKIIDLINNDDEIVNLMRIRISLVEPQMLKEILSVEVKS